MELLRCSITIFGAYTQYRSYNIL